MNKHTIMLTLTFLFCLLANTALHAAELDSAAQTRQLWGIAFMCILPATIAIIVALEYLDVLLFGREDVLFSTEENESK